MTNNIILIGNISDFNVIPKELINNKNNKKFSFDLDIHEMLNSKGIEHEIADNLLDQTERLQIFDKMIEFRNWHSKIQSNDYEIEGVNLLKLLDSHELGTLLISHLINLLLIKRIIKKENPTKIITTTIFSKSVRSITKNSDIVIEIFQNDSVKSLFWDKITVKFNFGRKPITFKISKRTYQKIKNLLETTMGFFYDFWFNVNNSKKKSIIFLEFNPQLFSKFFEAMKNFDGDIILINQRRSAIWNKSSLNTIRKSNSKVLKNDKILSKEKKQEIQSLTNKFSHKINELFENSTFFNSLFKIEDVSFWDEIKDTMKNTFSNRLIQYITTIYCAKIIFETTDVKCIVSLNETGETEKSILEFNKNKSPSILLEHGFVERIKKTHRFDVLSDYINFKDKISVWGPIKKEFLIDEYSVDEKKIIVSGSPRHDNYFKSRLERKNNKMLTLLLAPAPLSDIYGSSNTILKLRFNKIIKNILSIVEKLENVKIIVKLHPIQLKHNDEIKSLFQTLNNKIPIYLWTPVIDTINKADIVLVITPDIPGTSTMLLESMILGKPTMNIFFDDKIPEFNHIQKNTTFSILDHFDLENKLQKFLFDKEFQNELIKNADNFVSEYMSNRGNASEKLASILKSY